MKSSSTVYFVTDQYVVGSIKSFERACRAQLEFILTGETSSGQNNGQSIFVTQITKKNWLHFF